METVASGGWNIEKSIFHFGRVPNSSGQTIVRGPGQRFRINTTRGGGCVPYNKKNPYLDMLNEKALINKKYFRVVPIHKERLRSTRWIILPTRNIFFGPSFEYFTKELDYKLSTLQTTIELLDQHK